MRQIVLAIVLALPLFAAPKLVYTPEPESRATVAKLLDTVCKSQGQLIHVVTEGPRNENLIIESPIMFHSSHDRVLNFTLGMLKDPAAAILVKKCQFKNILIRDFSGTWVSLGDLKR